MAGCQDWRSRVLLYQSNPRMYLKQLEISGFKSFANPTTLTFSPPREGNFSITAIVGPNGSGKSNVADAIRWVLGEQSPKQLRGKKSEDVIFSGSEGRGQLSLASVSMVLDNRDHRANVEYEELIITRRVYRSGESEYLINGNQVRLLDLQLLLAQAQFGHGSYGVIGQGMIDRLLLQSAAERKSFFDEAVGIKEFQIKRHQSYLKLVRTRENITEADQLLTEIEPHLKTLKKQVKKLAERQSVEGELTRLQTDYYAALYAQLSAEITTRNTTIATLSAQFSEQEKKLLAVQTELAELARSSSRQEQFNVLEREYERITRSKNEVERQESLITGRLHTEYNKVGQQNVAWLEEKMAQITARRQELSAERDRLEQELVTRRETRQQVELQAETITRERAEVAAQLSRLEKKWFDARQADHEISFSGLRTAEEIMRARHQFGAVHGLVAQLGTVSEKLRLALEVAAGAQLSSIVVGDDRVAEQCIRFLKERQLGVATFLPINKIRPRPIPPDVRGYLNRPGVHGLAVDLVQYNSEFADIFSFVYGSTLIVDSIDTAREIGIGRLRMVTESGDVLETSGSMKGGYRRVSAGGLHFVGNRGLSAGENLADLEQELNKTRTASQDLETRAVQIQTQVAEARLVERMLEEKVKIAEDQVRAENTAWSELEAERALSTMKPEDYTVLAAELTTERTNLAQKITELDAELARVRSDMAELNRQEEIKRQRVFALQDEMHEAQTELNTTTAHKNSEQLELVKLETRREDVATSGYEALKQPPAIWLANRQEEYAPTQLEVVKSEIEKLHYRLSLIGGIDEEVLVEHEQVEARYNGLSSQLTDLKKAAADIETLIAELDAIMKKKHKAAFTKIKQEFARYFAILFEGGKADLVEVYEDESVVEAETAVEGEAEAGEIEPDLAPKRTTRPAKILAGIEVVAEPPGKRIKNIASLSGGERTLTSIALVSAILHTNPPPFVFLDEVEAALDEANTVRFNQILQELSLQSQFILITHNRATMHAADLLYGVTMGNDGVSKLLSVKLQEAQNDLLTNSSV